MVSSLVYLIKYFWGFVFFFFSWDLCFLLLLSSDGDGKTVLWQIIILFVAPSKRNYCVVSHCLEYLPPRWKFPPSSRVLWPDSLVQPHYSRRHSYHVVQATCFCCQGLLPLMQAHRNLLYRFTVSAHLKSLLLFQLIITLLSFGLVDCVVWSLEVWCVYNRGAKWNVIQPVALSWGITSGSSFPALL